MAFIESIRKSSGLGHEFCDFSNNITSADETPDPSWDAAIKSYFQGDPGEPPPIKPKRKWPN
jgi:hypothetical protein